MIGSLLYLPTLSLNSWAGGQWLSINEIYFAPFIAGSMFFFFYAVSFLRSKPIFCALLSTVLALAFMFAIPNVTYPVGATFYQMEEGAFARLSGVIYAFGTCLYCFVMLS